ncbi:hypothetical protein HNQ69_000596 [Bartonella callosciuri]|uniref:Uncharacterized protein n=1 Tax=Bartonella callosciuri TaxID=686223 RepID=A0A840NU46_9HYPH|nr:hypothetical protein [Bartonella callosciuri]
MVFFILDMRMFLADSLQSNIEVVLAGQKVRLEGRASGTFVDIQTASEALSVTPFTQGKADLL